MRKKNPYSPVQYGINISLILLLLAAILYSLPNFYSQHAVLMIRPVDSSISLPQLKDTANQALIDSRNMTLALAEQPAWLDSNLSPHQLLLAVPAKLQVLLQQQLQKKLGNQATVVMTKIRYLPRWLQFFSATAMHWGLDLQGGLQLVLGLDQSAVLRQIVAESQVALHKIIGSKAIQISVIRDNRYLVLTGHDLDDRHLVSLLDKTLNAWQLDDADASHRQYRLKSAVFSEHLLTVMQQTLQIIRNRVNGLGISEAVVQSLGQDKISVQLPGVQDIARATALIGKTATLQLMLEDEQSEQLDGFDTIPPGRIVLKDKYHRSHLLFEKPLLYGQQIASASSSIDENGQFEVLLSLAKGGQRFYQDTADHIGSSLASVYTETFFDPATKKTTEQSSIINIATIQSALGSTFRITGLSDQQQAQELAFLLRSGSLPVSVHVIASSLLSPTLGLSNIKHGIEAAVIGLAMVALVMIGLYRVFGLLAVLALGINALTLLAGLSLLGATLTLPSMAGIVLTLGMAIDANVLIFERMKEELRLGKPVQHVIDLGFSRAWDTIVDANVTTLIAAAVLFGIGDGPIRGFATTLCLGIMTSMISGVGWSKLLIQSIFNTRHHAIPVSLGVRIRQVRGAANG